MPAIPLSEMRGDVDNNNDEQDPLLPEDIFIQ